MRGTHVSRHALVRLRMQAGMHMRGTHASRHAHVRHARKQVDNWASRGHGGQPNHATKQASGCKRKRASTQVCERSTAGRAHARPRKAPACLPTGATVTRPHAHKGRLCLHVRQGTGRGVGMFSAQYTKSCACLCPPAQHARGAQAGGRTPLPHSGLQSSWAALLWQCA